MWRWWWYGWLVGWKDTEKWRDDDGRTEDDNTTIATKQDCKTTEREEGGTGTLADDTRMTMLM